jgi:hypothetical protein
MNGLQQLARKRWNIPGSSAKKYDDLERLQIRIGDSGNATMTVSKESQLDYADRLCQMRPSDDASDEAAFELVHIERNRAGAPPTLAPEAFKCLSENSHWFDHSVLDLLHNKAYGFYHVSGNATANQSHTFLVISVLYTLLWTYHTPSGRTKGMLVDRSCNIVGSSKALYEEFRMLLDSYQDHVHDPCLLVFISSAHLISAVDKCLAEVREDVRYIEGRTGHGGWHNQALDSRRAFKSGILGDSTMAHSKRAAECTTTLANLERQVELVSDLNDFVISHAAEVFEKIDAQHQTPMYSLKLATESLQQRLKHSKPNVSYLQNRAETQKAVVSLNRLR